MVCCKEALVVPLLILKHPEWSDFSCCNSGAVFYQTHVKFYAILFHILKQINLSPSLKAMIKNLLY